MCIRDRLEDISNSFKGVEKSFAIQAGREVRVMVIPEKVSDDDMILLARDIAKQVEDCLLYTSWIRSLREQVFPVKLLAL